MSLITLHGLVGWLLRSLHLSRIVFLPFSVFLSSICLFNLEQSIGCLPLLGGDAGFVLLGGDAGFVLLGGDAGFVLLGGDAGTGFLFNLVVGFALLISLIAEWRDLDLV